MPDALPSPVCHETSSPALHHDFAADVARTPNEVTVALWIRAAVFVGEEACPIAEEFDDNDFVATHILGYVDGQPVATMRIRWFAGFAKMERMAVLRPFRGSRIARTVIRTAMTLIQRKGYTVVVGHAQDGREKWWSFVGRGFGSGFQPCPDTPRFIFSGHSFTAMKCILPPASDALQATCDPMILNRPEGLWDRPGPLERGRLSGDDQTAHKA
jgi:predicted GNAT family N-acyltransferase